MTSATATHYAGKQVSCAMHSAVLATHRDGTPFTLQDVADEGAVAAGADLSVFFSRYVTGLERLPIEECARDAGYDALIQGYAVFLRPLSSTH